MTLHSDGALLSQAQLFSLVRGVVGIQHGRQVLPEIRGYDTKLQQVGTWCLIDSDVYSNNYDMIVNWLSMVNKDGK